MGHAKRKFFLTTQKGGWIFKVLFLQSTFRFQCWIFTCLTCSEVRKINESSNDCVRLYVLPTSKVWKILFWKGACLRGIFQSDSAPDTWHGSKLKKWGIFLFYLLNKKKYISSHPREHMWHIVCPHVYIWPWPIRIKKTDTQVYNNTVVYSIII